MANFGPAVYGTTKMGNRCLLVTVDDENVYEFCKKSSRLTKTFYECTACKKIKTIQPDLKVSIVTVENDELITDPIHPLNIHACIPKNKAARIATMSVRSCKTTIRQGIKPRAAYNQAVIGVSF